MNLIPQMFSDSRNILSQLNKKIEDSSHFDNQNNLLGGVKTILYQCCMMSFEHLITWPVQRLQKLCFNVFLFLFRLSIEKKTEYLCSGRIFSDKF